MNIFKTYVKRNLKNNRLRTTMTILGIILSVALVAAVIEGAFSGVEYVRDILKDAYGNHHGYALNMTRDTAYELVNKDEVEAYTMLNTVGWAEVGSQNSTKPYLLIKEASQDLTEFLSVKITEGHFPENDNEILLPSHLASNGNVQYKVGDTITLKISERYLDEAGMAELKGEKDDEDGDYWYNNEYSYYIMDGELDSVQNGIIPESTRYLPGERLLTEDDGFKVLTKTYTVCGIMNRIPYTIEEYMCAGYTAIVKMPQGSSNDGVTADAPGKTFNSMEVPSCSVFFRVKDPVTYNDFHNTFEKEHPGTHLVKNRELVAMYGGVATYSITTFITAFVAVLIALILFGSIALVYNSFSISINERTKQIGILKSVGATKKQIRKTILYEAFFDCVVSIPLGIVLGCLGMGVTFFLLQEGFAAFFGYFGGFDSSGIKIQLVLNIPLIIIAVVIVIIATLISIAIPALRASSVSPIDLVRQNADIKVSGKIRKSRILSHIFGAEGMLASKNYSRNKKRYRSTIVSLSVSIILFIAASSFCSYLNAATESELYSGNVDLIFYEYAAESYSQADVALDDASPDDEGTDVMAAAVNVNPSNYRETKEMLQSADDVVKVIVTNSTFDYFVLDPANPDEGFYVDGAVKEIVDEEDMALSSDNAITENAYDDEAYDGAMVPETEYEDLSYGNQAGIYFIDDESFNELLKSENISDPGQSAGVLNAMVYNEGAYFVYDEEGNAKEYKYNFMDEDDVPKKLTLNWYNEYGNPELSPIDQVVDKDGEVYVVYLDSALISDYYGIMNDESGWALAEEAVYAEFRKFLDGIGKDSEGITWPGVDDFVVDGTRQLTEKELALIGKCTFVNREELQYSYNLNVIGTTYDKDYQFSSEAMILLPKNQKPPSMKNKKPHLKRYGCKYQNKNKYLEDFLHLRRNFPHI